MANQPYFLMPFVVSLYHGIKRQVNGKIYCRNHKKEERDCNQARQTDAIIFSLSLTSVLLPYQYPLPLSRPMLLRRCRRYRTAVPRVLGVVPFLPAVFAGCLVPMVGGVISPPRPIRMLVPAGGKPQCEQCTGKQSD